ncbi:MAG: hypothetical protein AAGJ50_12505 [Pseudomonadota bacterium]
MAFRSAAYASLLVLAAACASAPATQGTPTTVPNTEAIPEAPATADAPKPSGPVWQSTPLGLRHTGTGLTCAPQIFDFVFTGEKTYPGLPEGQDVSCSYGAGEGGAVTVYLTNFGRAVSPGAHLKGTETSISNIFTRADPLPPPRRPDGEPVAASGSAFAIDAVSPVRPEVPVQTVVWIETIGAWHVKIRATYEADRARAVAALSGYLIDEARASLSTPPA